MAYRQQVPASWLKDSPNTAKLGHFYSVDQAVGVNSPNKREDVMLVQLMMSVIAATKLYIASQIPWNHPPIRVDGNGDQRMIARIYTYQLMNSSGLTINGRVDPAKTKESPIGQGSLMLMNLNILLAMDSPTEFRDLAAVKGVPADLAKAIKDFRP